MPTFNVEIREVWVRTMQIENADNAYEALNVAKNCGGTEINFEYSHELDSNDWTTYEVSKEPKDDLLQK